jgi:hypothetical protein
LEESSEARAIEAEAMTMHILGEDFTTKDAEKEEEIEEYKGSE